MVRVNLPPLSKSEWAVMHISWKLGEASARDIHEESLSGKKREYQTIKTMLDRLTEKGYLTRRKFGPLWLFKPAVSRAKIRMLAIEDFISTALDDTVAPLFAYFARKERLTDEEVEELEKLIEKSREKK